MKINGKYYYSVNVLGKRGYSFAVCSETELNEDAVIDAALNAGAFEGQEDDSNHAVVDNIFTQSEVKHFEGCTYNV